MTDTTNALLARPWRLSAIIAAALTLIIAAAWIVSARGADNESAAAAEAREAGFDAKQQAAIKAMVREYILENPEILPEAVEKLRAKQMAAAMEGIKPELFKPFPGAVLGNPDGDTVLVEFSDYACGYCRRSVQDVEELIDGDSDLKVVIRELPILSEGSVKAARMALAAAQQGKFGAFHRAMYETGKPTDENIEKAARMAGLDLDKARKAAQSAAVTAEIEANHALAGKLQVDGTPAWVTDREVLQGAVGKRAIEAALAKKGG